MTPTPTPIVRNLVLIGGGHSHVHVLKSFGMRPVAGTRLTLVTRDVETPYSGMLPGFVAGTYSFEECHIDLHRLARFAGARLIHDSAIGIDRAERRVLLADAAPVAYDLLSIDIGSEPRRDVPGAAQHAVPVKPVSNFAGRLEALLDRARRHRGELRVVVVGGGAGGTELALALMYRLTRIAAERGNSFAPRIMLVSRDGALANHAPEAARLAARALAERSVELLAGEEAVAVEADAVLLRSGRRVAADEIVWVTEAAAARWLADTGLALDDNGFIRTLPTLQTETDPAIYAAGDIAAVTEYPRPKAGVFAVRQGPPLADNLRFALNGWRPQRFRPQSRYLAIVGTGDGRAIATRGTWAAEGAWAWWLKDWIDRRWMRGYRELPDMTTRPAMPAPVASAAADVAVRDAITAASMRCGGCGAKVGATVLSRVLSRLGRHDHAGVLLGLQEPDDAAVIDVPAGKVLVQSVDFFRALIDDPYTLGRIAANHALGDLFAMGARPHSALALASVPYGAESVVEDDLFRLLSGAQRSLDEAGVAVIGGHSAEASELAIGFSVNGFADSQALLRKSGLRVGDALVLTKPLGTGVLFAAAMRGAARGGWLEAAVVHMCQSNRRAAEIVVEHGATGCTDVTGFGLAGHLVEMIRASRVDARLDLSAVPVMEGAIDMFARGHQSSLQADNLRARQVLGNLADVARDRRLPILFDPQTAGGLLAGVEAARAQACIDALRAAGYMQAAIVGRVVPGEGGERLIAIGS